MTRKSWQALLFLVAFGHGAAILGLASPAAAAPRAVAQVRPADPQPAATPREQAPLFDSSDSRETRRALQEILRQYPPAVDQVLRLDPSLAGRDDYLAPYPALAAFLAQHPEIARNPAFFFGQQRVDEPTTTRIRAMQTFEEVLAGFGLFTFFMTALGVVTIIVRALIDHRRWLHATRIQTDAHLKLVDRLTSNEDLLAYVQTTAGRHFLEAAPVPSGLGRSVAAPISRILWSVQAGVVLAAVGVGAWIVRNNLIEELAGPMSAVAVLAIALGAGFALSALVAYLLSERLGLLEPEKPQ